MLTEALSVKFTSIHRDILNHIYRIEDRKVLKQLLKNAILSPTLEEFTADLPAIEASVHRNKP
ncbi:MAG: hypothetical protein HQK66_05010 [Desulfamplus sp.]|nr:hypothetical protein [Desulfamplus sp.]